ncbi:MAG: DUF4291 domain-containing protein [Polyangiales bacterium]
MKLETRNYEEQQKEWPQEGRHILAHYDDESVVVYQAYSPRIGHFAAKHGYFGGDFSYGRMSWIKPNFLWMMYRSGWGVKQDQEVTLAVRLKREGFDTILRSAVPSSASRGEIKNSDIRLQWDPDHGPDGANQARRAIQLGLRGEALKRYGREWIVSIEDISEFVAQQRAYVDEHSRLRTPKERIYPPADEETAQRLRIERPMR